MVLPLLAIAGSTIASLLPGVISALAGSKNEAEARHEVAPQYNAMVAQLVGRGIPRAQAMEHADEAIKGAVSEKMSEGALPGWAEGLLSIAGGIGGWAAGAKLAARGAAKLAGAAGEKALAGAATKNIGKAATGEAQGAAAAEKAANTATKGAPDAALSKDELPAVEDPPQGLITPFGPKPLPRKMTPIESEFAEHSLQGPTGIKEIDELPNEAAETLMRKPGVAERGFSVSPVGPSGGVAPMSADEAAFHEARQSLRASPEAPPGLHRPFRPTPRLGYEPPSMPTDVHEERLMELAQHARRTPKRPPNAGIMSDLKLPFNEDDYVAAQMRGNPQGY